METDDPILNAYLDGWFALLRTRVQQTTWRGYDAMARIYLRPHPGELYLSPLPGQGLNLLYAGLV